MHKSDQRPLMHGMYSQPADHLFQRYFCEGQAYNGGDVSSVSGLTQASKCSQVGSCGRACKRGLVDFCSSDVCTAPWMVWRSPVAGESCLPKIRGSCSCRMSKAANPTLLYVECRNKCTMRFRHMQPGHLASSLHCLQRMSRTYETNSHTDQQSLQTNGTSRAYTDPIYGVRFEYRNSL